MSYSKTFSSVCQEERLRLQNKLNRCHLIVEQYRSFAKWVRRHGRVESKFADFCENVAVPIYEREISLHNESLELVGTAQAQGCAEIETIQEQENV